MIASVTVKAQPSVAVKAQAVIRYEVVYCPYTSTSDRTVSCVHARAGLNPRSPSTAWLAEEEGMFSRLAARSSWQGLILRLVSRGCEGCP